jgi:hypothetical protein
VGDLERLAARVARIWAAQIAQARVDARARAERRRAVKLEEVRAALAKLRPPPDKDP